MNDDDLLKMAAKAELNAYADYSGFHVGAALLGSSGQVFVGCNVENESLGLTMCAERVAIGRAVSDGVRDFVAIAVVTDTSEPILPCGACRQVLAEFNPAMRIVTSTIDGKRETAVLSALLPSAKQGILDKSKNV